MTTSHSNLLVVGVVLVNLLLVCSVTSVNVQESGQKSNSTSDVVLPSKNFKYFISNKCL